MVRIPLRGWRKEKKQVINHISKLILHYKLIITGLENPEKVFTCPIGGMKFKGKTTIRSNLWGI